MAIDIFPAQAPTFKIDVTSTASASKAINNADALSIRLANDGFSTVFVSIGKGTQTATLPSSTTASKTCTPILGGESIPLGIPIDVPLNISAICKSGETSTLYVQYGKGI